MSRYSLAEDQRVLSPFSMRGTGLRHAGGGAMQYGQGGKGKGPTGGFGPASGMGGLQMGAYRPSPGGLADVASQQREALMSSEGSGSGGKK